MKTETPANLARQLKRKIEYVLVYQGGANKERFLGSKKKSTSSNGLMNQSNKIGEIVFSAGKVRTSLPDKTYAPGKYGTPSYEIELLSPTRVEGHRFVEPVHLKGKFKWSQEKILAEENNPNTTIFIQSEAFSPSYIRCGETARDVPTNLISRAECGVQTSEDATKHLKSMLWGQCRFRLSETGISNSIFDRVPRYSRLCRTRLFRGVRHHSRSSTEAQSGNGGALEDHSR